MWGEEEDMDTETMSDSPEPLKSEEEPGLAERASFPCFSAPELSFLPRFVDIPRSFSRAVPFSSGPFPRFVRFDVLVCSPIMGVAVRFFVRCRFRVVFRILPFARGGDALLYH